MIFCSYPEEISWKDHEYENEMLKIICSAIAAYALLLSVSHAQNSQAQKGMNIMQQMDKDANGSISHAEFIDFGLLYFNKADQNKDQQMNKLEYALMLEMLGSVFPSEVFIKRFNILDMNRDSVISLAEFSEMSERKFRKGDLNGDGQINQNDVQ